MASRTKPLPIIKSSYDEGGEGTGPLPQTWRSPRGSDPHTPRLNYLEDRLQAQERTTQNLIDRAYKIKENIIDNLNITHGTWQEEKRSRELLQEHIRTITDIVRKLSRDIQYIEEHVKFKDSTTNGTSNAVKNLEMHHVAGLTDLRGRVARCDSNIARLSADLQMCSESVRGLSQQQQEQNARVMDRIQLLDVKLNGITSRLEQTSAEQSIQLRHVEGGTSHQIEGLDARTRNLIEEMRTNIYSVKAMEDAEREKLEARVVSQLEKANSMRDSKMLTLEKKNDESVVGLLKRIERLETDLKKEKEKSQAVQQAAEARLRSLIEGQTAKQQEEIQRLKRECREGFSTVHETIGNMKQVSEGKRRLLEEQLKKEIGQIRRMVVLI